MAFVRSDYSTFAQAMKAVKLFRSHEKKGLITIQSVLLEHKTANTVSTKSRPTRYYDASVYTLNIEYTTETSK
jgi:hypothetical protein